MDFDTDMPHIQQHLRLIFVLPWTLFACTTENSGGSLAKDTSADTGTATPDFIPEPGTWTGRYEILENNCGADAETGENTVELLSPTSTGFMMHDAHGGVHTCTLADRIATCDPVVAAQSQQTVADGEVTITVTGTLGVTFTSETQMSGATSVEISCEGSLCEEITEPVLPCIYEVLIDASKG